MNKNTQNKNVLPQPHHSNKKTGGGGKLKTINELGCFFTKERTTTKFISYWQQQNCATVQLANDSLSVNSTRKLTQNFLLIILFFLPLFSVAQTTTVTLNTVGSGIWQVPYGVTSITVDCYGGGGGGGGGNYWEPGTGGGGGGYARKTISVSCGQVFYYNVANGGAGGGGAGGAGGAGGGGTGGTSWVNTSNTSSGALVSGDGGGGGNGGSGAGSGGDNGGSGGGGTGDITSNGGTGGKNGKDGGGGGGGAGGVTSNGSNGNDGGNSNGGSGGSGGGGSAGVGGNGGNGACCNGGNGINYGAGGGGAGDGSWSSSYNGGSGAQGIIIITYTTPSTPSNITPITVTGNTTLCAGQTTTLTPNLPTGGDISMVGTDRVHRFTSSAASCDGFSTPYSITGARILIAGGGGGGGQNGGGGGAAGEFIHRTGQSLNAGVYSVLVGAGGVVGNNVSSGGSPGGIGGISYFNGILANGGGGGANRDYGGAATSGGSGGGGGGGASPQINAGGVVLFGAGTGNNGGGGRNNGCSSAGGGGGGSGGAGAGSPANLKGGNGGAGSSNDITGTSLFYAAGGGGGVTCASAGYVDGVGGSSIGGKAGVNPTVNTGSGGGGATRGGGSATAGANGVVIIRYPIGTPTWSSNNTAVATVVTNGDGTATVTAVAGAGGTADITYSLNDTVYKQTITVRPQLSPSASYTIASCANPTNPYADLSAAAPGSGVTGIWTKPTSGHSGTINNATSYNTANITGLSTTGGTTDVQWTLYYTSAPACSTALASPLSITPTSLANIGQVSLQSTGSPQYYNCRTCSVKDGNTYTYYDNVGKIIATIEDPSGSGIEMGTTEVCVGYDYNPANPVSSSDVKSVQTNLGDFQPYLPRYWSINPSTKSGQSVKVTLYFTKAEFDALQQKASTTTDYNFSLMTDLRVTKFDNGSGGSFTLPPVYPATNSSATLIFPIITRYPNPTGDYAATFNVNSFSTFYIHPNRYPFSPLPVELVSFTGWNQGSVNILKWVTASELNTSYFEVQHSTTSNNWEAIGRQKAAGNSNTPLTYDFTDNNPQIGVNYYRLKMVDNNGTFKYSNVINIQNDRVNVNEFSRVYPNPTSGNLTVEILSTILYNTEISVLDILGRNLLDNPATLTKGLNTLQFNFSHLPKGTYILRFSDTDGKSHYSKFVRD